MIHTFIHEEMLWTAIHDSKLLIFSVVALEINAFVSSEHVHINTHSVEHGIKLFVPFGT